MKKYICIPLSLLVACFLNTAKAQDKKIESLDSIFAGIPLQEPFEKWVTYISGHPFLGIDSTTERGIYSSFKNGMPGNFPFPATAKVKLLFAEEVVKLYNQKIKTDTVKAILIEGIFENSRQGEKASNIYFEELKKMLDGYYNKTSQWNMGTFFSEGFTGHFPDCMIAKGYSEQLKFPFIMLIFVDGKRIKDISPLKISKGYY